MYSSISSGSDVGSLFSASCTSLKASEIYLRNNSPSTTCLYSAASMLLRNLSAAFQSLSSKPRFAPFDFPPINVFCTISPLDVNYGLLHQIRVSLIPQVVCVASLG